ncbi:hypothetical protein ACNKHP_00325 [Shigella boydii]
MRDLATQATQTRHYDARQWRSLPTIRLMSGEIYCPRLHIRRRWFQRVGRVRWWSFLAANLTLSGARWQKNAGLAGKKGITRPEVFHALTTALRREATAALSLTEVNNLPVRQTPMFTLLREAGFQERHEGWIRG